MFGIGENITLMCIHISFSTVLTLKGAYTSGYVVLGGTALATAGFMLL
jgi:hypothetical protein